MSDSVRPHRRQPTRLPRPWDSPGKNTGVGCHFLLQCVKVKLLSRVRLLATAWTAAYQAPPSMGFSRQEYWSGVPLPSPNGGLGHEEFCQQVSSGSDSKERVSLQCRRSQFDPWVGKIPWRREWQPSPVFLPGESPGTEEPGGLLSMELQRVRHD